MAEGKKIIAVEDDLDFRESMVEYLTLAGFDITGVGSALEFYQAITRQQFQLAIVDIGLPDQDGLVLAKYIRNNTDMRIVMLTAQSSLDGKITAYRSGADTYLVKPIDFAELAASLQSMFARLDEIEPLVNRAAAPVAAMQQEQWTLSRNNATLTAPEGTTVGLTLKELDLLEKLAQSPNIVVERQALLDALDYENNELGNRALDALIHRLRRKKEELNHRLPLKTAHGAGYSFSESIVVE